ncbi:PREDICTED: kinesin-like protein KIN-7G isoform X2 [Tarenaya hassleriana]|nr:PREDICTED: kinesin-like protein KIN-7G isoform X2 [Tarenaya hassleriana]
MIGITDYTMADIYDYIDKHKEREFIVKFSAMEIYNESVRDLLSTDNSPLRLLDDPEKGTVVEKITEATLRDWNHFKELLSVCKAQRQIGETALNEVSSRSHQILRLTIESTAHEYLANDKLSTLTATVNFIDLAGSERASQSLSAGTRLKEGCHINRSLLTLGTVIRKLSKGKTGHIPFRDSKLTRILQSSLGGNARTAIICTMSPAKIHVEQSRNTLLFASCAKEVTTNAQVNAVMSDKVLVKHLQRELARLESVLRSPGRAFVEPDTAALLREKDIQIEKLNIEVFELKQQLDFAHSQIEGFKRIVGEETHPEKETSSTESMVMEHQYPKLRVRKSWDSSEIPTPESPVSAQPFSLSPRSTEHSYDENVFQLSDLRIDSRTSSPPQPLSFGTPGEFTDVRLRFYETETNEQSDVHKEETADQPRIHRDQFLELDEQPDRNSEDSCVEVRCIKMEEPGIGRYPEPNTMECIPNQHEETSALLVAEADSESVRPPTEAEDEEENVKEISDISLRPEEEREPSKTPPQSVLPSPDRSFPRQLDGEMSSLRGNSTHPDFITPSPEKPYSWLLGRDSHTFRGMRLMRSRSCRASFTSNSSFSWFDKDEKSENTPPSWYEKEFVRTTESNQTTPTLQCNFRDERPLLDNFRSSATWFEKSSSRRPVSTQTMATASQCGINNGMSSPNESQASHSESSMFELQNYKARVQDNEERTVEVGSHETVAQKDKRMIHCLMDDIQNKSMTTSKTYRDAGMDPIHDYLTTPLNWTMEFKRLQREIIELWHICNVSMGHRTYFFLLFRGDQKDCLYMEVELRRLNYIRESFHHGSKTIEEGRSLSPTSSMRALNRERYKLSQMMQKKLSREERENLFLRWGIGLNTKHRRLQLAHRLWSETKDLDHVRESASVVGKLLGFVDMDLASKEMYGLNFSIKPPLPKKKSSRWKRSVLSLSIL